MSNKVRVPLEPEAVSPGRDAELVAILSTAISLKRIADLMEEAIAMARKVLS